MRREGLGWLCALSVAGCMATPEPFSDDPAPMANAPANQRPVASTDRVTTREGQQVIVPILVNDRDPDGDLLKLVSLGQPGHGKVSANPNSSVTYTPDRGFSGNDAFTYTIRDPSGHSATSTVSVTVLGKRPNIRVHPLLGLEVSEGGGRATFAMVLDARPTADVFVALRSSDEDLGTVTPAGVTFTTGNWADPQSIVAIAGDDSVEEGNRSFSIVTAPAVSADSRYDGMDPADVEVTRLDDDRAAFVVTPTTGLVTTEAGGVATFTVRLATRPAADVSFALESDNVGEGLLSVGELRFTPSDWDVPQTVTLTGVADGVIDGDQVYAIVSRPAVSADPLYDGRNPPDVTARNVDVD